MKKAYILLALILSCVGFIYAQTGTLPGPGSKPTPPPWVHSGFRGEASFFFPGPAGITETVEGSVPNPSGTNPIISSPIMTYVSIYDHNGKWVNVVVGNRAGQFFCFLKPGNYTLLATLPGHRFPPRRLSQYQPPVSGPTAATIDIVVATNQFTEVEVQYSNP